MLGMKNTTDEKGIIFKFFAIYVCLFANIQVLYVENSTLFGMEPKSIDNVHIGRGEG